MGENKKKWEKENEKVLKITDRLGKEIDKGILETVIELRLLGFTTTGSCEGHINWGEMAPWVDIESKEAVKLGEKLSREKSEKSKNIFHKKMKIFTLKECKKIMKLLEEFYKNRKVPYHTKITMQWFATSCRLESQGAEIQEIESRDNKLKLLKEYQKEMKEFTKFLKSKIK